MDNIEARQNLEKLQSDKKNLEALNHLNSTHQFRQECAARLNQINRYINNIQRNLNA